MSNIQRRGKQIEAALASAVNRYQDRHGGDKPAGACQYEKIDRRTPLYELIDKDTEVSAEGEIAMRMYLESHAWLFDFLFADGPHPARVMLRLYAWTKKYRSELIWDMGYRTLAILLNESHAAMEWRIGVLLDEYAEARGLVGVKAPWQRTTEACRAYSACQAGNSNRLGGTKSSKSKGKKSQQPTKKKQ